jgi:DNA-binding MarR family transcriptional regulator
MEATVGLTAPQRMVLRIVGRFPGIAPARLAEILRVHPATLSVALKRLGGRGLVERQPDPDDRRSVRLSLSPAGRWYDVPSDATVESAIERALSRIPKANVDITRKVIQVVIDELDSQASADTP